METIFHPESEFHKFDFKSLKIGQFPTDGPNYMFGRGDHLYVHGEGWFITVFDDDCNEEIWQIPSVISRLIDWKGEESVKEFKRKVKNMFL